jgi:hypothetical protein
MIIGISGKKLSGKNEVADMLSYILFKGGTYKQFRETQDIRNTFLKVKDYKNAELTLPNIHSFAANLKKCVAACTGINFHDLEDRNVKSSKISWLGISYRKLLQEFGEGIRQTVGKNFWVDSLLSQYDNSQNWIISDVRYVEEANAILDRDGILIRVNRDTGFDDIHVSEISLDDFENFGYVIDNNDKSLEDLFDECNYIVEHIINWKY